MTKKIKNFIYDYWTSPKRIKLGEKMINDSSITDKDLLFLIPNNVKKMHGIPIERKARRRYNRKHDKILQIRLMENKLFPILEELIEEYITDNAKAIQERITKRIENEYVDMRTLDPTGVNTFYINE